MEKNKASSVVGPSSEDTMTSSSTVSSETRPTTRNPELEIGVERVGASRSLNPFTTSGNADVSEVVEAPTSPEYRLDTCRNPEEAPESGPKPEDAPKSGDGPEDVPKSGDGPEDAPKSGGRPKDVLKSGDDPEDVPKSGDDPKDTPKSGDGPEDVPKSGDGPKDAPKSGDDPKDTPKSGDGPEDVPKSGGGPEDVPKSGDDPEDVPKSGDGPENAPKSGGGPKDVLKSGDDPEDVPKSGDDPKDTPKSGDGPEDVPKSSDDPKDAPKSGHGDVERRSEAVIGRVSAPNQIKIAFFYGLASSLILPEGDFERTVESPASVNLDDVTIVDEIVGKLDLGERDETTPKSDETTPKSDFMGLESWNSDSFLVSDEPVRRAGRRTCLLCPVHTVVFWQSDVTGALSFDALSSVGRLSTPSNMDAFRSSDVFGRSDIFWQTDLLKSMDDDPVPSTSKSTPSTSKSKWSPVRRLGSPSKSTVVNVSPVESPSSIRDVERACDVDDASAANRSFITRIINRCCCGMGMKLRCFERTSGANSYFLLENLATDKDSSTEKQEELQFFDDNGSYVSVIVEKNLRAIDLTQLLAVKNRVCKDYCWSIVEHWVELGIERVLEDHEDVLSVHRQTESGAKKYIFRRFPNKYDFFSKPETYFPPDMIDLKTYVSGCLYPERNQDELDEEVLPSEFERVLLTAEELPVIFSQVNLQDKVNKRHWEKTFLLLKDSKIYMSSKVRVVAKFLRAWRESNTGYRQLEGESSIDQDDGLEQYVAIGEGNEEEQLEVLADLEDYEVYTCLNAKNQLKGPTEFGVVLRKTNEEDFTEPVVLSFDKGKDRVCWVTAMRLAKYGKQLRENYKAFKNKQETLSTTGSSANINESVRSRVAMDFTGKVGRIVEDPMEAKAIAVSEGNAWKKRLRAKAESLRCGGFTLEAGEDEISHHGQPWYHRGMSREQASTLISAHAKHDGVFVVRGSRSQPGGNVLSLKSQEKVIHLPIMMVEDPVDKIMCYTIDGGTTKFFDICQLIEFYRLNAGPLPTRLSNHLEKLPPPKTPSTPKTERQ